MRDTPGERRRKKKMRPRPSWGECRWRQPSAKAAAQAVVADAHRGRHRRAGGMSGGLLRPGLLVWAADALAKVLPSCPSLPSGPRPRRRPTARARSRRQRSLPNPSRPTAKRAEGVGWAERAAERAAQSRRPTRLRRRRAGAAQKPADVPTPNKAPPELATPKPEPKPLHPHAGHGRLRRPAHAAVGHFRPVG